MSFRHLWKLYGNVTSLAFFSSFSSKNEKNIERCLRRVSRLTQRRVLNITMKKIHVEKEKKLQKVENDKKLNRENILNSNENAKILEFASSPSSPPKSASSFSSEFLHDLEESIPKNESIDNNLNKNDNQNKNCKNDFDKLRIRQETYRRLRHRPCAPLPRKHWLFIQNGPPLKIEDLKNPAISIFDEDDGRIEEKLKHLKERREEKGNSFDESLPFWKKKQLKRKGEWDLPLKDAEKNEICLLDGKRKGGMNNESDEANVEESFEDSNIDEIAQSKWPVYKGGKRYIDGIESSTESEYGTHTKTRRHNECAKNRKEKKDLQEGFNEVANLIDLDVITSTAKMKNLICPQKFIKAMNLVDNRAVNENEKTESSNSDCLDKNISSKSSEHESNNSTNDCHSNKISETMENNSLSIIPHENLESNSNAGKEDFNSSRIDGARKDAKIEKNRINVRQGLRDVGSRMIQQLKEQAITYDQTNVNPTYLKNLKDLLVYYPGIEKQMRRKEMLSCTLSFEELLEKGIASVVNINALIKAKGMRGEYEKALDIYNKMLLHNFQPDENTFVSLMQSAISKKDANLARLIYLRMRSLLISPTNKIYCQLIKAHVAEGDINSAFALLKKMEDENIKADCAVYTTLIDGLVKKNKIEKAWDVFRNMRTWKSIEPDEVLFTVMIKACAKRRETEKALNLLSDMKCCGLYPTDITYTELIHVCSLRSEFFNKCFDFYNQMKVEDMPCSSQLFEYLLNACATTGNVKKGKYIVAQMGKNEIPVTQKFYVILIKMFANAMKLKNVSEYERICNTRYTWHIIHDMKNKNVQINTEVLNAVMQVYINGGYANHAIEMLTQFATFNCTPDRETYFMLLKMLAHDLKDPGRFFALYDYMRKNTTIQPDIRMLHTALATAMDTRSAKTTINILKDMYEYKVYPSPKLTDRLSKVGRQITEIHELISMFIKLQKEDVFNKNVQKQTLIQTQIDEHELKLFQEGKTLKSETIEEEVRKKYFKKKEKIQGKKGPWLPLGDYIQSKKKGGEYYAKKHDRPKPNLLQ